MTRPYTVLIPWADRPVLETTLAANRALFARHCAEVIIVNAGGDAQQLVAILQRAAIPGLRAIDLPGTVFNRQICLNIGARESRSDLLFLLDADISLRSDIFAQAIGPLHSSACFVAVQRIFESNPDHPIFADRMDLSFLERVVTTKELRTRDGRRAVLCDHIVPGLSNAGDGLVLLKREDLLRVGGLNSALAGYGYEDTDFQLRLQFELGLERLDMGEVTHVTHDASRVNRQEWKRNFDASLDNCRHGRFLGTLEQDTATWADRLVILPV